MKRWINIRKKLAKEINRRSFLLSCRRNDILPSHITNQLKSLTLLHLQRAEDRSWKPLERLGDKLLTIEINSSHKTISKLKATLISLKDSIISHTSLNIFRNLESAQLRHYNRIFHDTKRTNIRKFNKLKDDTLKVLLNTQPNWIKNISNVDIPDDISKFLALGPKFLVEPILNKDLPMKSLLGDVDCITSRISDPHQQNLYVTRATNIITNFFHNSRNKKHTFFHNLLNKTRRFLMDHPEIIVTRADKGNVTVIMLKQLYIDLCSDLINNDSSYIELNSDPTLAIERQSNNIIKKLFNSRQISQEQKKSFTIYNTVSPKFYALPKIHKPTLSVRPIVASIGSPTQALASFVTEILTLAHKKGEYYIKDSFDVSQQFNRRQLPHDHVIASLDVVSLFSNVYLEACIRSISKHWSQICQFCDLTLDSFINIISFLFQNNYFSFNNKIYKQTFGSPMGAKLSPILADYVMDDLLDLVIQVLPFNLFFIKKYVDDLIVCLPSEGLDEILDVFNSYDPHIQFTIEKEDVNHSVPFLDTRFIRTVNNVLLVDWFRKPTASGRFLNFNSYHKMGIKINLVKQMKARVTKISDATFLTSNLHTLANLFINNSYPRQLVHRILFSTEMTIPPPPPPPINEQASPANSYVRVSHSSGAHDPPFPDSHVRFAVLPYVKDISPKISRLFKELNCKIAFKSVLTINKIFSKVKDKVPLSGLTNIVYSINCNNCNLEYIGQTSRSLKGRIVSHKSDARLHPERCALASHIYDLGHTANYEEAKILEREAKTSKRIFLEMAHIFQSDRCMNKKSDIKQLCSIYSYLLHCEKFSVANDSLTDTQINSQI
nr:unnamed protein product [Callosobruchus chinensis]